MTQTLLVEKNDAGQETISLEEIQRKIIQDQALKLWLYYGENSIPLERDGKTHIITMQNKSHKATTRSGQTLDLTEQEQDYLRQYAYQHTLEQHADGKTIVPAGQGETSQELEEQITQKDRTIQQQARTIERQQAKLDKIHEVQANTNMSYSDRTLMTLGIFTHTDEFLDLKPFVLNVSRLQTESGVGKDTMTNFLASLHDAHAIKYHNKPNQKEDGGFNSASTVVPLPGYARTNTKAAARRVKQREKVTERRLSRGIPPTACENCGSVDPNEAYAAIVPFCSKCEHVASNKQERVLAKSVRIVETVEVPSHEFSEATTAEEWIDGEEEVIGTNPSPEFSDLPLEEQAEIQETPESPTKTQTDPSPEFSDTTNSPFNDDAMVEEFINRLSTVEGLETLISNQEETPSPEFSEVSDPADHTAISNDPSPEFSFSEGERVSTPSGIGVISFIGEVKGRKRYRVKFSTKQRDGTNFTAFDGSELEPVVQTSLIREE